VIDIDEDEVVDGAFNVDHEIERVINEFEDN
jgi:hypothetical protein